MDNMNSLLRKKTSRFHPHPCIKSRSLILLVCSLWSYPAIVDRLTLSAIGLKRYLLSKFTGDIRSMPEWRLSGLYQASIH